MASLRKVNRSPVTAHATKSTASTQEYWDNYEIQRPDGSWTTVAGLLNEVIGSDEKPSDLPSEEWVTYYVTYRNRLRRMQRLRSIGIFVDAPKKSTSAGLPPTLKNPTGVIWADEPTITKLDDAQDVQLEMQTPGEQSGSKKASPEH